MSDQNPEHELALQRSEAVMAVARTWGIQTHVGLTALVTAIANVVLLDSKHRDYGSGNIARFGEMGVVVRASDKLARLETLVFSGRQPNHETVLDTWRDLSLYALVGQLCHAGSWPGLSKQPESPQVITMGQPEPDPAPKPISEPEPAPEPAPVAITKKRSRSRS